MPTAPATPFCVLPMSLLRKMRMMIGRNARIGMNAPSWFWMKNLTGSFSEAGSN